jgi:hypothetical protein
MIKHVHHTYMYRGIVQQSSLLVPSKLEYARDETHRSRKTETKTKVKKGEKGRAIKKQKGGEAIKIET